MSARAKESEPDELVRIKRVYEPSSRADGRRILVDRLWPRGVSKSRADLDDWRKDLAPSPDLRKWFSHDVDRWTEFSKEYRAELREPAATEELDELADWTVRTGRPVTLVYAAADEKHTHALVLAQVLRRRVKRAQRAS